MVGILITTIKEKWFLAGLLAAALTYKPQFVVGFLILWLIWKKFYPILVFILFSMIWNGTVLITKGITPYLDYLQFVKNMVYLPYVKDGFPTAILSTPYSLIASMISFKFATLWNQIYLLISIVLIGLFCWLTIKMRKQPIRNQNVVFAMVMILPILITPYALLHDLLLLFPVLFLLAIKPEQDRKALKIALIVYLAMLVLPLIGIPFKLALTGLIPLFILFYWGQQSLELLRT
jgi:hypothetical protein